MPENPATGPRPDLRAPDRAHETGICVDFGRNVVRLTGREWFAVGLVVFVCIAWMPDLWKRYEPWDISPVYRVPFAQSEDYWTYHRLLEQIVETDRIPVIGDSFVWGEYVPADKTFSSFLNAETASERFANVGLNGAHPLALAGLVRNYAGNVKNRPVILHCNLLWMSSPERDLQSNGDVTFNHPRLLPQFVPHIAAYKAPLSQRLSIVFDRDLRFFDLVTHVRTCYFDGRDLQSWSIANPYANPLVRINRRPLDDSTQSHHDPIPWTRQGIERQDLPWIDLDSSLQWRAWRDAAERLRSKGNRVLAVIGPFNEHLLLEPSRQRYRAAKQKVEAWLRAQGILFVAPALLPSDEYGDASHPLSSGYARLAKSIRADRAFQEWFNSK
jgi:hypothetical protein